MIVVDWRKKNAQNESWMELSDQEMKQKTKISYNEILYFKKNDRSNPFFFYNDGSIKL